MASKIKVGDKFYIAGSDGDPLYVCVSVEPSPSGDIVYGRPVGSLFVSVRLRADSFVNCGEVEKL